MIWPAGGKGQGVSAVAAPASASETAYWVVQRKAEAAGNLLSRNTAERLHNST